MTTWTKELIWERAGLAREAQEKLREGIDLLEQAIKGHPSEANTKAYVVDHLRILTSGGHGFMSRDKNLDDVIDQIESLDPDYDPDDEGND